MNERLSSLAGNLAPGPVLVTGARGRIGQRLVEVLQAGGVSARAMSRGQARGVVADSGVCHADLTRADSLDRCLEGVIHVFHLASYAPAAGERDPENNPLHRMVTVTGTENLLQKAAAAGVGKLVFASSTRAIDGSTSLYARAKAEAEQKVLARQELETTVLRLPPVYGFPRQGSIARMLAAIDAGRFPPLPDFSDQRSLVHVDDVVQALLLAALSETANRKTYTVTDLQVYSSRQIYELICHALGKAPSRYIAPRWLLQGAAAAGSMLEKLSGRAMPLNREKLRSLSHSACFDGQPIVDDLGYVPLYDLEKALPEIVQQYKLRA